MRQVIFPARVWGAIGMILVIAVACDRNKPSQNLNNLNTQNQNNANNLNNHVPPVENVVGAMAMCSVRRARITWQDPVDASVVAVMVSHDGGHTEVSTGVEEAIVTGLPDDAEVSFPIRTRDVWGRESLPVVVSCRTPAPTVDYAPWIGPYLTLVIPDPEPMHGTPVALDPASNMIVNYESKIPEHGGRVYYRTSDASSWMEAEEADGAGGDDDFGRVHHVRLSGLVPDTVYFYQVAGPGVSLSREYSFRTMPVLADRSRFLVLGDQQDEEDRQRWSDVVQAVLADHMDEFDFILLAGDMAKDDTEHDGERHYWWRVFFEKGQELFARKPVFATPGNHDTPANPEATGYTEEYWSNATDTRSFRKYFAMEPDPVSPDYYHFVFGNAFFAAYNTEIPVFYGRFPGLDVHGRGAAQDDWLQWALDVLGPQSTWVIVFQHVPPFNPAGGKVETGFVRPVAETFSGRVDWSFSGHVHQYQRTRPLVLRSGAHDYLREYGRHGEQGVGFVVVPPAGQWPRAARLAAMEEELASFPRWAGEAAYEIGFTIVQMEGDTFSLRTWGLGDVDGRNASGYGDQGQKRLIDAVMYTRRPTPAQGVFPACDYRGSSNGWNRTAMTLVADHLWETTVLVSEGETPKAFKFFTSHSGDKWYGDDEPRDNKAHSNELSDIPFGSGPGTYTIRFHDYLRDYTLLFVP